MYANPINTRDHAILTAVQRAAVRVDYMAHIDTEADKATEALAAAHELATLALDGRHGDALNDALYAAYDTGDRRIPVFPRDEPSPVQNYYRWQKWIESQKENA